jgi:hypothetical protein
VKRLHVLILLAVILITIAGIRFWPRRAAAGAATPAECIDTYYESLKSNDFEKYLRCLNESYRGEAVQHSFVAACRDITDLKGVVQQPGPIEGELPLWIDVEEVRTAGVRRLRYHLCRDGGSWVITAIDPPRETPSPIRYGTPVGEEP